MVSGMCDNAITKKEASCQFCSNTLAKKCLHAFPLELIQNTNYPGNFENTLVFIIDCHTHSHQGISFFISILLYR